MAAPTLTSQTDEDRWIWETFYYHSRTFSLAARLLPRSVQLPIATLYLFCRRVDTIADQRVLEVGRDDALDEVRALERQLNQTLAGHPPSGDVLWPRLADVHERFTLQREPLYELIEGAVWDLEDRPVRTLDDLVAYSNLVGGSVGAMMLPFLLSSPDQQESLEAVARELGIAMQITNIIRDVGEDIRRLDRVYLPSEWLEAYDVPSEALGGSDLPDGYPALLERTMEASELRYEMSFEGIDALPFKMRFGIRAAARMYREIMNEVRANTYDNLTTRAYVTLPRKLRLVVHDDYARRKARLLAS